MASEPEPENQIYKDMIKYLEDGKDYLVTRTKCLMTSVDTERHFESFKEKLDTNANNVAQICNLFKYNSVNNAEVEPKDEYPNLISATTYNDYYKFTMAPVIGAVEDHRPNVHVTFAVDLRDAGIAKDMLEDKKGDKDKIGYHAKLGSNLTKLALRKFNHDILDELDTLPAFKGINTSYWKTNRGKIFGESTETCNTLLGRNLYTVLEIKTAIKDSGFIERTDGKKYKIDLETDFHKGVGGEPTVVLNKKFHPTPGCNIVVLSMYVSSDAKKTKEYMDNKQQMPDPLPQKLNIEATGKWRNVSWLETSMMQTVYETAHTEDLSIREISYGQWLTEALFRTYLGMKYLEETCGVETIKVALFSGRRTGGFLYNLLQVYLWSTFSTPFHSLTNKSGRNLGTSSVDAWYQLNSLKTKGELKADTVIVNPAGTHAHELSMVLSSIYAADLDNNKHNLVLTQVLGHYLYYKLTHQTSQAPMPMLPDTLGTESFLRAANVINVPKNDNSAKVPFLSIIGSARQDSGELKDFIALMDKYNYTGGKMASEIDDISDFNEAQSLGYGLAGVGGALGDSEKAWNTTGGRTFTASMAVKAVRVFFNGELHVNSYPVKTGDGGAVKVTADTTLNVEQYNSYVNNANGVREANKYSDIKSKTPNDKLVYDPTLHTDINTLFESLSKEIIANSKQLQGGRRMKSNMRKITKTLSKFRKNKRITKSIRKTRRSYRRY